MDHAGWTMLYRVLIWYIVFPGCSLLVLLSSAVHTLVVWLTMQLAPKCHMSTTVGRQHSVVPLRLFQPLCFSPYVALGQH